MAVPKPARNDPQTESKFAIPGARDQHFWGSRGVPGGLGMVLGAPGESRGVLEGSRGTPGGVPTLLGGFRDAPKGLGDSLGGRGVFRGSRVASISGRMLSVP